MTALRRIQLSRAKGWRKPANTVVVARPTKWGNPYRIGSNLTHVYVYAGVGGLYEIPRSDTALNDARRVAVQLFRDMYACDGEISDLVAEWLEPLRGKNLACWCPLDAPCHGDVLLDLANRETQ